MPTDTLQITNNSAAWNPIEANLYGAPAFFSGDTPINIVRDALDTFALAYSQAQIPPGSIDRTLPNWRPGDVVPEGFEIVVQRGRQVLRRIRTQADEIFGQSTPSRQDDDPLREMRERGVPLPPRTPLPGLPEGAPGGPVTPGVSCSPWDVECIASKLFGSEGAKDIGKRVTLLVFALVLLVVAIVSLR